MTHTPLTEISRSEPSLCIPRSRHDTDAAQVRAVFEQLFGAGCVASVDERQLRDSQDQSYFKRYFIHFKEWPCTEASQAARQKFLDGQTVKVVYAHPWFWKCSASRRTSTSRPETRHMPTSLPKPRTKSAGNRWRKAAAAAVVQPKQMTFVEYQKGGGWCRGDAPRMPSAASLCVAP